MTNPSTTVQRSKGETLEYIDTLPATLAATFEADSAIRSITINLSLGEFEGAPETGFHGYAVVMPDRAVGPFPTEEAAAQRDREGSLSEGQVWHRT